GGRWLADERRRGGGSLLRSLRRSHGSRLTPSVMLPGRLRTTRRVREKQRERDDDQGRVTGIHRLLLRDRASYISRVERSARSGRNCDYGLNPYSGAVVFCPLLTQSPRTFGR